MTHSVADRVLQALIEDIRCHDEEGVLLVLPLKIIVEVDGKYVPILYVKVGVVKPKFIFVTYPEQVFAFDGGVAPIRGQVEEDHLFKDQVHVVEVDPVLTATDDQVFSLKHADVVPIPQGVDGQLLIDAIYVSLHVSARYHGKGVKVDHRKIPKEMVS